MNKSRPLSPFETLYEVSHGADLPLPGRITQIYGRLAFPSHPGKPYILSNFVTSLDGVVTLGIPGHSGGGDISGFNPEDRFLMGLLRAVSDIVIISDGILAVASDQVWTPGAVYPPMAEAYQELRSALGKEGLPVTAIITLNGKIDPSLPVFRAGELPVAILTTLTGVQNISAHPLPARVKIIAVKPEGLMEAAEIVAALQTVVPNGVYLMEAGPHLHAEFIAGKLLDEIFLTLAPQVAGRIGADIRPGLVADQIFAPDNPIWGRLHSIKRSESHLFLRYGLPVLSPASTG